MSPAASLLALGAAGTASILGLALGRRLISPVRFAQIVGGLGCGLVVALTTTRLLSGGGHG
ncbi:hypothetical protein [Brevundimonas pondensis]|uniref:Uncharacterized protein n=1 Tax=Brevundimonas pondensis TaxID=2774189 RepID=A0ABX7SL72_9CAUL|nr:hypothetical protein [Brevundimonas pondensis]QTC88436.1 hypothetical protein IFE19_03320 [Brevundimonas pondensis]